MVTGTAVYAVITSRTGQGFMTEVDGQLVDVLTADRILRAADRLEMLDEVLPTIGKPAAFNLHRELGRLGLQDHYQTAANVRVAIGSRRNTYPFSKGRCPESHR
ncbi:hypothetical protein GCM10010840_21720 [Deinococcus aerolatus]|uniref:Uncharacterized protein n=1 Tax=Deinococcus aerolatus TaxID=522487 RepID=A0ABQ2GAE4_9DEIO|nr:hypothetical protein GCM10010840_21720 [Deinococcus aerolatus]